MSVCSNLVYVRVQFLTGTNQSWVCGLKERLGVNVAILNRRVYKNKSIKNIVTVTTNYPREKVYDFKQVNY